jgi:hypothetical protein
MKVELKNDEVKKFEPLNLNVVIETEEDLVYLYRMVGLSCPDNLNKKLLQHPNTPLVKNTDPIFYSLWPVLKNIVDRYTDW